MTPAIASHPPIDAQLLVIGRFPISQRNAAQVRAIGIRWLRRKVCLRSLLSPPFFKIGNSASSLERRFLKIEFKKIEPRWKSYAILDEQIETTGNH